MKIFSPGQLPLWAKDQIPIDSYKQLPHCHVAVSRIGMCLFVVHTDHIMVVRIIGNGAVATLALRKYVKQNIPIYFLGHTEQVKKWGREYFEEVGTLFRYKGEGTVWDLR